MITIRSATAAALLVAAAVLAGCGGAGAGRDGSGDSSGGSGGAASLYANQCAPTNALARDAAGNLLSGYRSGTLTTEKSWVRTYMNDVYLWYREMPEVAPELAAYNVTPAEIALDNYFQALKTPQLTASGKRKDQFSFTYPTAAWNALSQSGVVNGYGFELVILAPTAPRSARVGYLQPGSQAASAGVARGDALLAITVGGRTIDFVSATSTGDLATLNTTLFSPATGSGATFRFRTNGGTIRDVPLTASQVATQPVLYQAVLTQGAAKVGYLVFNDFVLPGEGQLKTAFQSFESQGLDDLVLDLRYNGGGYVFMASQLAYMIAPPSRTGGRVFERYQFNDKRTADSRDPNNSIGFLSVSSGIAGSGTTRDSRLPNLNLSRVFVLTSASTCSASESVINGLRGVDVEVVLIGGRTCGKPYGFVARDNCGLSYFPIEFQGVNDRGVGDFADGFAPACAVADDFDAALGSSDEDMLAAALAYRTGGVCAAISRKDATAGVDDSGGAAGQLVRPPARSGKYLAR
ncbi:MAG: S41 family peptidase [Lautropia sp.]